MALFTTIIGYWLQTVIRCLSGGLRNLRSAEKDIFSTQCLLSRMYLLAVRTIPSTLSLNKRKKSSFHIHLCNKICWKRAQHSKMGCFSLLIWLMKPQIAIMLYEWKCDTCSAAFLQSIFFTFHQNLKVHLSSLHNATVENQCSSG